jgi:hypothetical protein
MVKDRQGARTLRVVADDQRLVTHSGLVVVDRLSHQLGLERALTDAIGLGYRRHPPGRTLVRMACTLLAGGDCVSHLSAVRDQPALFGSPTAHATTAWRLLAERLVGFESGAIAPELAGIAEARRQVRSRAWQAGMRPRRITIDIDTHQVIAHSEHKEAASVTFKHGFGFAPMLAYLAETNEALAGILRPGCGSP